jgi:hypothetical protein
MPRPNRGSDYCLVLGGLLLAGRKRVSAGAVASVPVASGVPELRARLRAAEKSVGPVVRESVSLSAESFEGLVTLAERGLGRKVELLREAVETGIRVMLRGSEPAADTSGTLTGSTLFPPFKAVVGSSVTHVLKYEVDPEKESRDLVGAALGRGNGYNAPILTPPSQLRETAIEEDGDGTDEDA